MVVPLIAGAAILAIGKTLFEIMGSVSFLMFIEEEGIQVRGFGIMSLIREKLVDEVEPQLAEMRVHTTNLETFVDTWGWLCPYMQPTYSRYVQSTYDQIDAWEAWVISIRATPIPFGLRVASQPAGAQIIVDGTNTNFLTPHTISNMVPGFDLSVGAHTIELTKTSRLQGDLTFIGIVIIEQDVIQEVLWTLTPQQGKIKIASSPNAAEVWINNTNTDFLTPHTFLLDPGTHDFVLKYDSAKRGELEYAETITIVQGYDSEFRWILEEL